MTACDYSVACKLAALEAQGASVVAAFNWQANHFNVRFVDLAAKVDRMEEQWHQEHKEIETVCHNLRDRVNSFEMQLESFKKKFYRVQKLEEALDPNAEDGFVRVSEVVETMRNADALVAGLGVELDKQRARSSDLANKID